VACRARPRDHARARRCGRARLDGREAVRDDDGWYGPRISVSKRSLHLALRFRVEGRRSLHRGSIPVRSRAAPARKSRGVAVDRPKGAARFSPISVWQAHRASRRDEAHGMAPPRRPAITSFSEASVMRPHRRCWPGSKSLNSTISWLTRADVWRAGFSRVSDWMSWPSSRDASGPGRIETRQGD